VFDGDPAPTRWKTMRDHLRKRRDAAAERMWAAEDADPSFATPAFVAALAEVVRELEAVAVAADTPEADPVEVARTYRFLGGAYFDAAQKRDPDLLRLSIRAYERADAVLPRASELVEAAKLDFNFANTLAALSAGTNILHLSSAHERYHEARKGFAAAHLAPQAQTAARRLDEVDMQLRLSRGRDRIASDLQTLEALHDRLQTSDETDSPELRRELERIKRTRGAVSETLQDAVSMLGPLAPPDAVALAATPAPGAAPGRDAQTDALLEMIKGRYLRDRSGGVVPAERQATLERILEELGGTVARDDDTVADLGHKQQNLRRLMQTLADLGHAGSPTQPDDRIAHLTHLMRGLYRAIVSAGLESNVSSDARGLLSSLIPRFPFESSSERLTRENTETRQLAMEARSALLRDNLLLIQPLWSSQPVLPNPNRAFCSVGPALEPVVRSICRERSIETHVYRETRGEPGAARWDQLRQSAAAIVDLTDGPHRELAYYELGLALVIGVPIVVLADEDDVAFNVDVRPTPAGDRPHVERAIDAALFGYQRTGGPSSVRATIDHFRALAGERPAAQIVGDALDRAAGDAIDPPCPVLTRNAISAVLGWLPEPRPVLATPTWSAAYPDRAGRRLFHVMPFLAPWSNAVKAAASRSCDRLGIQYRRHDDVDDPRIIHSLWRELCVATDVLVDVTPVATGDGRGAINANVLVELGIAHALGRRVHLVGQPGAIETVPDRVPAIAKLRIERYASPADLERALGELLA
jgi:hypothetical protein